MTFGQSVLGYFMSDPSQTGRENFQRNLEAVERVIRLLNEATKDNVLLGDYENTRELQRAATCLAKVRTTLQNEGPKPCFFSKIVSMIPRKVRKEA